MDRIDRIGPRPAAWTPPALDPDREDIARRRREDERRRRERREPPPHGGAPQDEDPPHHVDVRA